MDSWFSIIVGVLAIIAAIISEKGKKQKRDLERQLSSKREEESEQESLFGLFPVNDTPIPAPKEVYTPIEVNEEAVPVTHIDEEDLTVPYNETEKKKERLVLDPEKMILFSAILKPKFEEN